MRLFVALKIPSEAREKLVGLIDALRAVSPQTRWVRTESLHITLKFIGELPETRLAATRGALNGIRSNQPIRLDFRGIGFFPNENTPRVLWVGVEASPNLEALCTDVDLAMETLGIVREQRAFSPHLTLARFEPPRLPEKLRSAIRENAAPDFGFLRTDKFDLIESKLKPSGAEYTTLESFAFVAAEV
jgi:2'-5' RNA ligase